MKDYEKAIEEAAYTHTESLMFSHNSLETKSMARRLDKAFTEGAKSEAAKEFHQQGMYTEQEMLLFAKHVRDSACSDFEKKSIGLVKDYTTKELFNQWPNKK